MIAKDSYRRRDPHPKILGLFYWGKASKGARSPIWLTIEKLEAYAANQLRLVKAWQKNNPQAHRANQKRLRSKHGKARNARSRSYRNEWKKQKRKTDPLFALKSRCSDRLRIFLKLTGRKKRGGVDAMLGCGYDKLCRHLESQFQPGMTWGNAGYHGWHIDHKIPLASAKTMRDVFRLFHYTNLQPLWQKDNFSKGDKMPTTIAA
jgi:hypothetical protein